MDRFPRALLGTLILVLTLSRAGAAYELDKDKLSQTKRVAIFSIYGEEELSYAFSTTPMQPIYDLVEARVVEQLKARGLEVVPLEQSQRLVQDALGLLNGKVETESDAQRLLEAEFVKLYLSFLPEHMANFALKYPSAMWLVLQVWDRSLHGIGYGTLTRGVASSNTSFLPVITRHRPDTELGGEQERDRDAVMKTLGRLAQKLDADGFVVVRLHLYTKSEPLDLGNGMFGPDTAGVLFGRLQMDFCATDGSVIFRDRTRELHHRDAVFYGELDADTAEVTAVARATALGLLWVVFQHLDGEATRLD